MEQKILSLKDDKINSEVELFEYPAELRGGRNLISLYNIASSNGRLNLPSNTDKFIYTDSGYCTTGKIATANFNNLTLSISNIPTGYVALGFFDEEDIYRSRPIMQTVNIIENFTVVVPSWATYCRVSFKDNDSGFIKLEKGSTPTDWTPAPEDLNLSYPDHITEFKPSISDRYILTVELIEGQPTSFSNKITTNEFKEEI